jgi:2-methylisocitrate lyase-like PEP mutase family enzyme
MTPNASVLAERCERLRALHVRGAPVVLPNAWDAASARAVAAAGFAAVATTSGGVAASLGYEDHEAAPVDDMLAAAGRIVRAVDVPVTVDFEAGYGLEPDALIGRLHGIGAAGANIEDTDHAAGSLAPVSRHADRLRAIRSAAERLGYPLVLNARVDVFLLDRSKDQRDQVPAAVERARAYLEAGADCVYPIFLIDASARRAFLDAVDGFVNLLVFPGADVTIAELAAEGVARVSYGTSLHHRTMAAFAALLQDLR